MVKSVRGIDTAVCQIPNRFQQSPLTPNGLEQRDVCRRQRVFSPRLAESLRDRIVVGLEKDHLAIDALVLDGRFDVGEPVECHAQIAGIDYRRDAFRSWFRSR
jgi:hypothetical protein